MVTIRFKHQRLGALGRCRAMLFSAVKRPIFTAKRLKLSFLGLEKLNRKFNLADLIELNQGLLRYSLIWLNLKGKP